MRINTKVVPIVRAKLGAATGIQAAGFDNIPCAMTCDSFGNLWTVAAALNGAGTPESLTSGGDNLDNVAEAASGRLFVAARLYGFAGAGQFDRIASNGNNSDAEGTVAEGLLKVNSTYRTFNSATYDRVRSGSAVNLATFSSIGSQINTPPGNWSAFQTPAAATQATCNRAAGAAGVRNVCTSIQFSVSAVAAQATLIVVLRDGATGAGTIIWSTNVGPLAIAGNQIFGISGLNIPGTAATAMTLEFTAAPAATNFESVAMTGYQAP